MVKTEELSKIVLSGIVYLKNKHFNIAYHKTREASEAGIVHPTRTLPILSQIQLLGLNDEDCVGN